MKPLALSITAFGAFSGHVDVDFAALAPRGLFLVSGETGTGKTTIFDAMCWALYGTMPHKESHEVRSDHVGASTRCEVSFRFESGGVCYQVTRNPEQLRPAARNAARTAKEAADASLVRIAPDGSTESLASKVAEVTRSCEAIIGLDAIQFQRVVLLPQGDFGKFLNAKTDDREKILDTLFDGRVYDRIVDELKRDRDRCSAAVGDTESSIRSAFHTATDHLDAADDALSGAAGDDPDTSIAADTSDRPDRHGESGVVDGRTTPEEAGEPEAPGSAGDASTIDPSQILHLRERAERVTEGLQASRDALTDAISRRDDVNATHERLSAARARFDRAESLREMLDALDRQREAVDAERDGAVASKAARPIVEAGDALERAQADEQRAITARDKRQAVITRAITASGAAAESLTSGEGLTPAALSTLHAELRASLADERRALDAVGEAEAKLRDLLLGQEALNAKIEECSNNRKRVAARIGELDDLLPTLRAAAVDPEALRAAISRAEAAATDREMLTKLEAQLVPASEQRAGTAARHRDVLRAFTETQAPRLAAGLQADEPCPVCGSTDHPRPASAEDGTIVDWAAVQAAEGANTEANEAVRKLETAIDTLRGRLGDAAGIDAAALQAKVDELRDDLQRATDAATRLAECESEHAALTASLTDLATAAATLTERHAQADQAITAARAALESARTAASGVDAATLATRTEALEALSQALDGYEALVTAVNAAGAATAARRADLADRLNNSDYADVTVARAALVPVDAEATAIDAATAHADEHANATGALDEVTSQGIPESRPDLEASHQALEDVAAQVRRREELVTTVKVNLDAAHKALGRLDELESQTAGLRGDATRSERAYRVCAKGGPALPVSLKRWVLAHELDRITRSANAHLAMMTNGRYSLHRRATQSDGRRSFGLDLEVGDTDTGRRRSTASLSGGEQFQASLALALGLADVIAHGGTAGGQHFEALFVDEGFGSLSADALDDAVETLQKLHATGRTVGAITHVEAMKEVLHVGIEVLRRDDGRGSTLRMNP